MQHSLGRCGPQEASSPALPMKEEGDVKGSRGLGEVVKSPHLGREWEEACKETKASS